MRLKEAIILAGGMGTRLQSVVQDVPKPMALINGRPFLEYLMDHLIDNGISRCIFSVGYKSDIIRAHFGNRYRDCDIEYVIEKTPLGTGGAIKESMKIARESNVLVTNGDSLFLTDIKEQFSFHMDKKSDVTLALKPMKNFDRYGTVVIDDDCKIIDFREKEPIEEGLINGGVYIFNVYHINAIDFPEKFSIENDFFQSHIGTSKFSGFESEAYFLDIGVPSDFNKAQEEFADLSIKK